VSERDDSAWWGQQPHEPWDDVTAHQAGPSTLLPAQARHVTTDPWADLPPTYPAGLPLVPTPSPSYSPTLVVDVGQPAEPLDPPRPPRRGAWLGAFLASAAGVLLAIGLVAAFVLRDGARCDPAAWARLDAAPVAAVVRAVAAPPVPTTWSAGIVTFYGPGSTAGACASTSIPSTRYTAALGPVEYADAAACGSYIQVKGRKGTILVKVTNLCPECPPGHLDLSDEAFAALDDRVKGRVPMTYRAVRDPAVGPLSVTVKDGSNPYWLAVHVDDHGNPLRSVEVASGQQGFQPMQLQSYGYWLDPDGAGAGPFRIRVTDVRGHRVVVTGVRLRPGTTQRTGARLYGAGAGAAPAPTSAAPSSASSGGTTAKATATPTTKAAATATKTPRPVSASVTASPAEPAASVPPAGAAATTAPDRC
jgi:expansin (peptidoglycan-binding protein)